MPTLLVNQLHFARSELKRCLDGLSEEDACRRLGRQNCLSWMVGHLASQEHGYWVLTAQGRDLLPDLSTLVGSGRPASTPPLAEMWDAWQQATTAADEYLGTLGEADLTGHLERNGQPIRYNIGTMLLRNIYHYWFHIGEAHGIRQQLGHPDLPEFVGDQAGYGV
jgi:hypothetical protein